MFRAYALAAGIFVLAPASQAGIPDHDHLTQALETRRVNPVIRDQAQEALRICCVDAWEAWDRRRIPDNADLPQDLWAKYWRQLVHGRTFVHPDDRDRL